MRRTLSPPLEAPAGDDAASWPVRVAGRVLGAAIAFAAHAVTGVRAVRHGVPAATSAPRVYFANHASHGDIVLIRATLPEAERGARPVAASDYWERSPLRRFLGRHVFDVLAIDRAAAWTAAVPLRRMLAALDGGDSLILFPEGTRNTGATPLLPFKCGLYYLGQQRPGLELVPVWVDNAARALPKGRWLPVPVLCAVRYGAPMRVEPGEDKAAFMQRAASAVDALRRHGTAAP